VILGSGGSGGSTSTAPKPLAKDPAGAIDMDACAAEEMANSMLRDSPVPDIEGEQKQSEDVPAGKSIVALPLNFDFSFCLFGFLFKEFFPRSSKSGASCGEGCGCASC